MSAAVDPTTERAMAGGPAIAGAGRRGAGASTFVKVRPGHVIADARKAAENTATEEVPA